MPIAPLNDLHSLHASLRERDLPLLIHGPIQGDITLICYGEIAKEVIEAALFLDRLHTSVSINVVQIQYIDPLPIDLLQKVLLSMRHILLIESDIDIDLHKILENEAGFTIYHRYYLNPDQDNLKRKITELISQLFITSK